MHSYMSRIAGAAVSSFLFIAIAHAQATINDCEKIQAADAYNQCLAKFGPAQKAQNLEPERPSDVKDNSAEAAAGAGPPKGAHRAVASHLGAHHRGGRALRRRGGRGGRKRLVISVGHRRHR